MTIPRSAAIPRVRAMSTRLQSTSSPTVERPVLTIAMTLPLPHARLGLSRRPAGSTAAFVALVANAANNAAYSGASSAAYTSAAAAASTGQQSAAQVAPVADPLPMSPCCRRGDHCRSPSRRKLALGRFGPNAGRGGGAVQRQARQHAHHFRCQGCGSLRSGRACRHHCVYRCPGSRGYRQSPRCLS